jgi:hypothetical protein
MDRRRFLRTAGLGLATIPLGRFLSACGDADAVVVASTTSAPTTRTPTTPAKVATTQPVASEPVTTPGARSAAPVGAICREAWGGSPAGPGLVPHTIERLTVHHTAAILGDNRDAPGRLRGHQAYHKSLGWPDLAYHMAVDANGNIYAGRATSARGDTATNYDPSGHFLVVAEGDFNSQELPAAQLDGVATVLAWAAAEFSADPATIRGHRDWASTSCPGESFYPLVANGTLESMVDARLEAGGVELVVVCDDSAFAAVAAIENGEEPQLVAEPAAFYLRDTNSQGPADRVIEFGERGWLPVSGHFGE